MNKNTIIGTLLISVLIMWYMSNSISENEKAAAEQAQIEAIEQQAKAQAEQEQQVIEQLEIAETTNDSISLSKAEEKAKAEFGAFYKHIKGEEKEIVLENELLKVTLTNKGAQVKQVELKDFTTWQKTPLLLINNTQQLNFKFISHNGQLIETENLYFDVEKTSENTISFKVKAADGKYYEHLFSLNEDSYFLDFDIHFVRLEDYLHPNNIDLSADWTYNVIQQEKGLSFEKQKSTIYWRKNDGEVEKLSEGSSKTEDFTASEWIAFKDQFFNTTLLSEGDFEDGKLSSTFNSDDTSKVANYFAEINFTKSRKKANAHNLQFFFGPNDYKMLKGLGRGQEEVVELGSTFFLFAWVKYIAKGVILPIFHFLDGFNLNYGIIIILLTFIIRMALMPLTFKSYVSSAKTKLLKPELDALKEKYKDDQQKFAAEQMKLYQKAGVSMFGGCLPMLLQMPFFLAMFYFFPSSIELRQQSFLWATDLSTYDVLFNLPFHIPIYGAHVSGFTLLMTISSIVMARFNPQMQNQNIQPGMEMLKYMPYIFPIFLMLMFNSWSAALTFYYFISNLITLGQQLFIHKFMIDEDKLRLQLEENKKKPVKKGSFRARMDELYKQQQLEQQKQKKQK